MTRQLALGAIWSLLIALPAAAESEWISFDGAREGTPAEISVDLDLSSETRTVVDVHISGMWVEPKESPGGLQFSKFRIPGLGFINEPGAPELPVARLRLAIPTDAERVAFEGVEVEGQETLTGVSVWPHPIPELDGGEEGGTPEQYVRNDDIYRSAVDYPPTAATPAATVGSMMGPITGADTVLNLCRWNPTSQEMTIITSGKFVLAHDGSPRVSAEITKDRGLFASHMFTNWVSVASYWPMNFTLYSADYLIVHPDGYIDELQPFIAHLKTRGYRTRTISTTAIGSACVEIRNAIRAWYLGSPANWDQYCLLVGDVDEIPFCDSPLTPQAGLIVKTDDLYASPIGDNLTQEVYVGRLSIDSEADLTNQLNKIMDYTNNDVPGWNRNAAALVAHEQGAPGKYQGSHENVRTYVYSNPPQFTQHYGSQGATNGNVSQSIELGVGVVAYRGHGNSAAWTGWNNTFEYYDKPTVLSLDNGVKTPVVWSISCTNANLASDDCIAETWMEHPTGGAVSHYGATRTSYTTPNHTLNEALFVAAFDWQQPTQALTTYSAELVMAALTYEDNAWMYLLNGDPSMPIRDEDNGFNIVTESYFELCEIPCDLFFNVYDELSNPVPGALVSVWKSASAGALAGGAEDEVFDNRYADAEGNVTLTIQPQTTGFIHYSVRDGEGHVTTGQIPVVDDPVDVPEITAPVVSLTAIPSVMQTSTTFRFGTELTRTERVHVVDAGGRLVANLRANLGQAEVHWDGRDRSGARVGAGVYYAAVPGTDVRTRLVVVR